MGTDNTTDFWNKQFATLELAPELDPKQKAVVQKCLGFFGDVSSKTVLDIGCGLGGDAIRLARLGANVTAIDISETAIEKLNKYAQEKGLHINCYVLDAFSIKHLGQFDFVIGSFILHHIEPFDDFCEVLFSVLKPGGKAFFHENNAASRFLVWMRENVVGKLWIPKYGDADEFPLKPSEVDMLRRYFAVSQVFTEMVFFRLASIYLLNRRAENILGALDEILYRNNILVRYSYQQLLLIEKAAQDEVAR